MSILRRTIFFGLLIVNELLPAEARNILPRSKRNTKQRVTFKPVLIPFYQNNQISNKRHEDVSYRKGLNVYLITLNSNKPTEIERLPLENFNDENDINNVLPAIQKSSPYVNSYDVDYADYDRIGDRLGTFTAQTKNNLLNQNGRNVGLFSEDVIQKLTDPNEDSGLTRNIEVISNNDYEQQVSPMSNNEYVKQLLQKVTSLMAKIPEAKQEKRFKAIGRTGDNLSSKTALDPKLEYEFSDLVL